LRNITFDLIGNAERRPEAPALLAFGESLTYGELNALTWKSATYLYTAGVRSGDVVTLTFTDQINMALAMLGTIRLGATVFSVPPSATPYQRREMANRAAPASLATDIDDARFDADIPTLRFRREWIAQIDADHNILDREPKAPGVLVYSSGSTGAPKLTALDHLTIHKNSLVSKTCLGLQPAETYMMLSGLGFNVSLRRFLATIFAQGRFALASERDPLPDILGLLPDVLHLSVFHAEQILAMAQKSDAVDFSSIRITTIGASVVSEDLRMRIRRELNTNLHVNYGTTETNTICFASPTDIATMPGTVGRPPQGVAVELVDEEHRPLPAGQVGEVRVKSPAAISGYHDGSHADRFRDGWFYPGDLAMWTEDGQLVYFGRSDHMMIRNGINIYPAEIERALIAHPLVRDAASVPLKHPVHQDIPVCAVALHPSAAADPDALLAFARERLGARAPSLVFILDEIPRNEQGKLVRAELMEMIRARLERRTLAQVGTTQDAGMALAFRQLITPVTLEFTAPEHLSFEQLNEQLKPWTQTICPGVPVGDIPDAQSTTPILAWLRHTLLIAREILQAAKVPVFDEPQVLACEPAPTGANAAAWKAVCAFPRLDQMPGWLYDTAVKGAMNAAGFALANPMTEENRQTLFSRIENGALAELRKSINHGKSTFPVLQAANARGIPFTHLGAGVYQLGWGSRARRIDRSTTEADSAMGLKLSNNKVLSTALLARAGLPHPQHEAVATIAQAAAAARRIGWPVVVKPADRERGEGVSVDVTNANALETAFTHALGLSQGKQVLVERQVEGVCHRLFIAQGRLLYAVKRMPMGVWGDGLRPIRVLVADEWRRQQLLPPWKRSEIQPIDDLARTSLQQQGHEVTSIPASGTFVPLRRIETTARGGVDEDVSERVHPENLRVAISAARLFGLDVAGIDIITTDIGIPWFANGAIINEVNFAPLLGGGEISRKRIPALLDAVLDGNGRIPVHLHVGGTKAFDAAYRHWQHLVENGKQAVLTTATRTWTPSGEDWPMSATGLYSRCRGLILSAEMDALVCVVQTDEFLETGLPLEVLTNIHEAGDGLLSFREGHALDEARTGRLRALMRSRCRSAGHKPEMALQIPFAKISR